MQFFKKKKKSDQCANWRIHKVYQVEPSSAFMRKQNQIWGLQQMETDNIWFPHHVNIDFPSREALTEKYHQHLNAFTDDSLGALALIQLPY